MCSQVQLSYCNFCKGPVARFNLTSSIIRKILVWYRFPIVIKYQRNNLVDTPIGRLCEFSISRCRCLMLYRPIHHIVKISTFTGVSRGGNRHAGAAHPHVRYKGNVGDTLEVLTEGVGTVICQRDRVSST